MSRLTSPSRPVVQRTINFQLGSFDNLYSQIEQLLRQNNLDSVDTLFSTIEASSPFQQGNTRQRSYTPPLFLALQQTDTALETALALSAEDAELQPRDDIHLDMPTKKLPKEDTCSVCLSELAQDVDVYDTPCNHYFHKECLDGVARYKPECPLCRIKFAYTEELSRE